MPGFSSRDATASDARQRQLELAGYAMFEREGARESSCTQDGCRCCYLTTEQLFSQAGTLQETQSQNG